MSVYSVTYRLLLAVCFIGLLHLGTDAQEPEAHPGFAASGPPETEYIEPEGDERLAELTNDLSNSPDDPILLNNISVRLAALGRLDEALHAGIRSVEADGEIAVTRLNLAGIYDRLGRRAEARAEAVAGAKLEPENVRARVYVCELDLILERVPEAAECFREAMADFPEDSDLRIKYGVTLLKAGQLPEAKLTLEKADQEDPEVLVALAAIHFRSKDFERCTALLKEAVEMDPADPRIRFNLAMAYLAVKNRPGALSQYNLIKSSAPKLARKLYKRLFARYVVTVPPQPD